MSGRAHHAQRLLARLLVGTAAFLVAGICDAGIRGLGWTVQGALRWPIGHDGHAERRLAARSPRLLGRVQAAAAATDTFDPWTVLGIPTDAGVPEARKAYKKLIAKYHPDVDPSAEAEAKFQQIVRAHAVVTGEDREMDTSTLLKNAVENLRNDMEFKKAQIEKLKAKAKAEEEAMLKMAEQLKETEVRRDKVTAELGVYGGTTLGFLAGGLTGAFVGAVLGLAVKDREDALGQVIRGVGTVSKGVTDALTQQILKKD